MDRPTGNPATLSITLPRYHAVISPDYQLVINPAYNRDRSGPVHVVAVRLHVEF